MCLSENPVSTVVTAKCGHLNKVILTLFQDSMSLNYFKDLGHLSGAQCLVHIHLRKMNKISLGNMGLVSEVCPRLVVRGGWRAGDGIVRTAPHDH